MRKDEEVIEVFYLCLEQLKKLFKVKEVKVTLAGTWVTIVFGNLYTIKARGYVNTMRVLYKELEELAFIGQ